MFLNCDVNDLINFQNIFAQDFYIITIRLIHILRIYPMIIMSEYPQNILLSKTRKIYAMQIMIIYRSSCNYKLRSLFLPQTLTNLSSKQFEIIHVRVIHNTFYDGIPTNLYSFFQPLYYWFKLHLKFFLQIWKALGP